MKQKKTSPPKQHAQRIENTTLADCLSMAHPRNPKEHSIDDLIASIKRFGFVAPPTIDENTRIMVAGHGRCQALAAMKDAGESPPVGVVVDGDDWLVPVLRGVSFANPRERDMYLVADNQHVIAGAWNLDALTKLLAEFADGVEDPFAAFEGIGFSDVDLQTFGVNRGLLEAEEDDDDGDEPTTKVKEHERKLRGEGLNYRVMVSCRDEDHQAELLERFETEGLEVSPLIT